MTPSLFGDLRLDDVAGDTVSEGTRKAFAVHRSPVPVIWQTLRRLQPLLEQQRRRVERVLLPAAGDGRWGRACRDLWPNAHLTAVEPRAEEADGLKRWCDEVIVSTIQDAESRIGTYDLIVDNPPFSLLLDGTRKPSQSAAMRAFLPLRLHLASPTARLVLYWLTDLGQRSRSAVDVMDEHVPIEQWRIPLPISHNRTTDLRNYSIWHWSARTSASATGWRCRTLPVLSDRDAKDDDMEDEKWAASRDQS